MIVAIIMGMIHLRSITLLCVIQICVGCGQSEEEEVHEAYGSTIEDLEERIRSGQVAVKLRPKELRHNSEFIIPSEQAALAYLEATGPDALRQPLVLWGSVLPNPTPEAKRPPDALSYSHYIHLNWREIGSEATGVYFQIEDGDVYDFNNSINPEDEELTNLINHSTERFELFLFSHTAEDHEKRLFRWSPDLYSLLVEEQRVEAIGLILKDGSRTKAAPFGYSLDSGPEDDSDQLSPAED